MSGSITGRCEVLIVGAGPTGLVLALWLARQGVAVRIVDKTAMPGTTSRALAVHARTLELYGQLDLADAVVARGHKTPAANLWVKGHKAARILLADIGANLTPYSFMLIFPQDEHERLLVEKLAGFGIAVERNTELVAFDETDAGITARLRHHDGREDRCEADYIAGCDGARSKVREIVGTGYPGGTYRQLFYVADIEAEGAAIDGELHVDLDEADFLAVFPLAGAGRARLIGTVRDEQADNPQALKFEDVNDRAMHSLKFDVRRVNWFSTYHVHHRVSAHFRKGRAFLLGDAAHIHSPAGGQGMNTGIGDAINLAWKLAHVLRRRAPDELLDSYESERIQFAKKLVATTDRAFKLATAPGRLAAFVRTRLVPFILPRIARLQSARRFMFRAVSQTAVNYRNSSLSRGKAGRVQAGERLPWVRAAAEDNYASLSAIAWQVHVYGAAPAPVAAWCARHGVALHVFAWQAAHATAGLARDAIYLLRPDTYVALAAPAGSAAELDAYFRERHIEIADVSEARV